MRAPKALSNLLVLRVTSFVVIGSSIALKWSTLVVRSVVVVRSPFVPSRSLVETALRPEGSLGTRISLMFPKLFPVFGEVRWMLLVTLQGASLVTLWHVFVSELAMLSRFSELGTFMAEVAWAVFCILRK